MPASVATSESITSGIASRYASSLFDLALESGTLDLVETDLKRFDALMRGSEDLMRLVRSPVFTTGEQSRAIGTILEKAKIGELVANFVRVVARNRRLFVMPAVLGQFGRLAAAHRGEVSADVTVAQPLSAAHAASLKKALEESADKTVAVNQIVDPSVLGGMIVKIGSRQIDTSLRTKLSSLKLALKEVG